MKTGAPNLRPLVVRSSFNKGVKFFGCRPVAVGLHVHAEDEIPSYADGEDEEEDGK